jgi:hypothetical protein
VPPSLAPFCRCASDQSRTGRWAARA